MMPTMGKLMTEQRGKTWPTLPWTREVMKLARRPMRSSQCAQCSGRQPIHRVFAANALPKALTRYRCQDARERVPDASKRLASVAVPSCGSISTNIWRSNRVT